MKIQRLTRIKTTAYSALIAFAALFGILALTLNNGVKTASAAEGYKFMVSESPGEYFDARDFLISSWGLGLYPATTASRMPDYSSISHDVKFNIELQTDGSNLSVRTGSAAACGTPITLTDYIVLVRFPDGTFGGYSEGQTAFKSLIPWVVDDEYLKSVKNSLWNGSHTNPVFYPSQLDRLMTGYYDVFCVLEIYISLGGGHSDYALFESNAIRFFYGPSTPIIPPEKEGHTFNGWYKDAACTVPYPYNEIVENITLYAGWTVNSYTVSFDSAGGVAVAEWKRNYGAVLTDLPIPTRYGYAFCGWQYVGQSADGQTVPAKNITLTAVWEPIILTVTFYVDDEVYARIEVPFGTVLSNAVTAAQSESEVFTALYADPRLQTTLGINTVLTEDMTVYTGLAKGINTQTGFFERIGNWFAASWVWLVVCAVGLAAAGLLSVLLIQKKRGAV